MNLCYQLEQKSELGQRIRELWWNGKIFRKKQIAKKIGNLKYKTKTIKDIALKILNGSMKKTLSRVASFVNSIK